MAMAAPGGAPAELELEVTKPNALGSILLDANAQQDRQALHRQKREAMLANTMAEHQAALNPPVPVPKAVASTHSKPPLPPQLKGPLLESANKLFRQLCREEDYAKSFHMRGGQTKTEVLKLSLEELMTVLQLYAPTGSAVSTWRSFQMVGFERDDSVDPPTLHFTYSQFCVWIGVLIGVDADCVALNGVGKRLIKARETAVLPEGTLKWTLRQAREAAHTMPDVLSPRARAVSVLEL